MYQEGSGIVEAHRIVPQVHADLMAGQEAFLGYATGSLQHLQRSLALAGAACAAGPIPHNAAQCSSADLGTANLKTATWQCQGSHSERDGQRRRPKQKYSIIEQTCYQTFSCSWHVPFGDDCPSWT